MSNHDNNLISKLIYQSANLKGLKKIFQKSQLKTLNAKIILI